MPIQRNEENGGTVLVLHISGKLVKADYEQFVPEFERLLRQHGKLRVKSASLSGATSLFLTTMSNSEHLS
jgi:hypothetical protein